MLICLLVRCSQWAWQVTLLTETPVVAGIVVRCTDISDQTE